MRVVLLVLTLAVAATSLLILWSARPFATHRPNVLLVTVDTWRSDSVGCLGGSTRSTPVLDALAARGLLFERAYAQTEVTPFSHMSILTSRRIEHLGSRKNPALLAQVLSEQGYATAAVVSTCSLNGNIRCLPHRPDLRFGRGFDSFRSIGYAEETPEGRLPDNSERVRPGRETTDLALTWLQQREAENVPWFLWVHYFDLHQPITIPGVSREAQLSPQSYAAAVTYVDGLIGELLEQVRDAGEEQRTIVVVTGDHGEAMSDHGLYWAHAGMYEEIVRVPLIVVLPDGPRGKRIPTAVENIDIMPTVLSAAGIPPPRSCEGRDLARDVEAATPRLAFSVTHGGEGRMVTDGRWKYMEYAKDLKVPRRWLADGRRLAGPGDDRLTVVPAGTRALFDLDTDADETKSLMSTRRDLAERLSSVLLRPPQGTELPRPSAELEERLRSLGY